MKLTKLKLKQIIKEEMRGVLKEMGYLPKQRPFCEAIGAGDTAKAWDIVEDDWYAKGTKHGQHKIPPGSGLSRAGKAHFAPPNKDSVGKCCGSDGRPYLSKKEILAIEANYRGC